MGTRALTRVYDESGLLVMTLYSQYDGYPSGLGRTLREKLGHLKLVNGIQSDMEVANGMGCFAAQVVAALKDGPGGFYLHAPSEDLGWIEFVYEFRPNLPGFPDWVNGQKEKRHLMLKVMSNYGGLKTLYDGPFVEFDPEQIKSYVEEG